MRTSRRGARWIAAVLGVALVGSAIVAYLLIRVTAPTAGGDQGLTAVTLPDGSATAVSDPLDPAASTPTPGGNGSSATGSAGAAGSADSGGSTASNSGTGASGGGASGGGVSDTAGDPSAPPLTTPPGTLSGSPGSGPATPPNQTVTPTSVLPGSAVTVPAAWSGTAVVEITMTGTCKSATPTRYSTPADVALDVAGGGASVTQTTATAGPVQDAEPTLTIGVNASAIPTVAVYSASVDNGGSFHRFWALTVSESGARTDISGSVVNDDALSGNNPNLLVDALRPPAACTSASVAGLPRVLAIGSTLNGWVDARSAYFTLRAVTTDGQRAMTVTVSATRRQ